METADQVTEGSPLKSAEDGTEMVAAPSATELKKKSCKDGLGLSRMTHWRTAAFFLSLFLCLTVVFAFSFIIPCPERPQYNVSWSRDFSEAATYDFLAVDHANSDKVMDVLFAIKSPESSPNKSCAGAGLSSPCLFLLALDGTKGETLWERPLEAELHWAQCGLQTDTGPAWHCLVAHSDNLTAVDKYTGDLVWQQPQPAGLSGSPPLLSVPDLDGDKLRDVVLVASDGAQTQLILLSGKTGARIGSTVVVDSIATGGHLLHRTKGGSYYVLLQKDTGVYGLALGKIAARAKPELGPGLKQDKHLEKSASNTTGLVPIYLSEAKGLMRTKDSDDSSDLLVVSRREVAMVDGGSLKLRWTFNVTSIIGFPSFGHFNKDEVLDVVVEDSIDQSFKRIIILDGQTGGLLWQVRLLASPNSPRPDGVHTANSFSVFMFWGLIPSESNSSESSTSSRRSYMLHPLYPDYLLESTNVVDHIVTFRVSLMERGRHAAYFLLTGPEQRGAEGTVVLTKRKLKQDVSSCNVHRIGTSGELHSDEDLKEAFYRLRFSSDW
ncbi:protein FAM234A isoform 1-T2 [Anableps anableps]